MAHEEHLDALDLRLSVSKYLLKVASIYPARVRSCSIRVRTLAALWPRTTALWGRIHLHDAEIANAGMRVGGAHEKQY